ncbi:M14 family metallopeptidase [Peribacillus sp. B-H-3]|jgi:g-D-glutamyl-meso-diaminopimelate peptidase|uniref:M14 family metallopeptidase n=1 Tax=Peribacillus sp. B-H-3 TaxID=3400420 RepID=UPI003B012A57
MKIMGRPDDASEYYQLLFGVPAQLIEDANPGLGDGGSSRDGLVIPGYTVRRTASQSMREAAAANQLSLDALLAVNEGKKEAGIYIPERIREPAIMTKKPYDYELLISDLKALKELYPFLKIKAIGKSVLKREIFEVRLGRGPKVIHYNGAFHANEWITSAILMKWLNELLLSMANNTPLFGLRSLPFYDDVTISIVPMVNPDGVELVHKGETAAEGKYDVAAMNKGSGEYLAWKSNIRGVDLNNQFPAGWDIEKVRNAPQAPSFRDYPGDRFLTEPEAVAMWKLAKESSFDKVIALHTQGKEFYWGYESKEPDYSYCIASEFERRSPYRAVQYIDSHGGYKDWFIQEFRQPGFTLELGFGINPLPLSQMEEIYIDTLGILMAGLYT